MKTNEYKKPTIQSIDLSKEDVIATSNFDGANQMKDDFTDNNFWGNNNN